MRAGFINPIFNLIYMMSYITEPGKPEEILKVLNPIVKEWFFSKFKEFALPQKYAVLNIHNRKNTLVSAVTGSGKTLTAFLSILNELITLSENGMLKDRVYAIYVSPLKSLNNDLFFNLEIPLQEMERLVGKNFGIRINVRTGDTTASEKQRMLKNPPHILVTTPESLSLMLTSVKFKELLKNVQYSIVDECLPYKTKVVLNNNKTVEIGKIVEQNLKKGYLSSKPKKDVFVKSYNLKTKKFEDKKITRVYKIENKKNLIRIHTKHYFLTLEITEDHPIAVLDDTFKWVKASELKTGQKLLIYNNLGYENKKINDIAKKNIVILDKKYFYECYLNKLKGKKNYKNQLKMLNNMIKNLEDNGLLPLTYNSDKLPIISRIIGHLFGDGWLTLTQKTKNVGFSGDFCDLQDIEKDIKLLGFKIHSKSIRKTSSEIRTYNNKFNINGTSIQFLAWSRSLVIFLNCLGVPIGSKTDIEYNIPKWLINAPKEIKREFLSAFNGSEGMKPIPTEKNAFYAPRLVFNKRTDLKSNALKFASQLSKLFMEFRVEISNIKIKNANIRRDGTKTISTILTIKNNEENLIYLYKHIGFTYCSRKEKLAKKATSYLLAKLFARENYIKLIDEINKLRKKKKSYKEISNLLGIDCYKGRNYSNFDMAKVGYWIAKRNYSKAKRQLRGFISFEEFEQKYNYNQLLVDEITKVFKIINSNYVYDLTIKDNHNFIANNILVHNCHALAENKRGVHLSLSLERLQYYCESEITRIGLSATCEPIEEIAKFLVGNRDCKIAKIDITKKMDIKVLSPVPDLINTTFEKSHDDLYDLLDQLIQQHRTTLIFTNTRSATERVVHHLKEKFPQRYTENIGAHHGSLSKQHRLNIEQNLRDGKLKCVVCSTSLELGIDIGYIDLVILLGSPKSVARAMQRIGRSGHSLHETIKGKFIVLDRDDLVECAVLLKNIMERKIDKIHIPRNCLDVLAQQIDGIAITEKMHIDSLFKLIKKSYCYSDLERKDFMDVIDYLTGKYISLEDRYIYAKIWYDQETGMIGKKGKMARVIHMTNIGTIPEESFVTVKINEEIIGHLDEAFLEKLKRNDIFVLGGFTYKFLYAKGMVAYASSASGEKPTVPSWFSDMLPLSFDLANDINRFRKLMREKFESKKSREEILSFINEYLYVDENAANSIYEYFREQFLFSKIPDSKELVVEFFNENERKYVVFHSLYGRRVNDVLSRALAFAISRLQHRDIEIGISDNGFYVSSDNKMQVLQAFNLIKSSKLREIMDLAIENSEVLKRRFRHCATRALMILKRYKGREKYVGRQQVSSMILMNALKRISNDFSILKEARREVLEDLMDIDNAEKILKEIEDGKIKIKQVATNMPSPFAFNLVLQGYLDVLKMEDRIEFIKRMHSYVLAKINK